MKVTLALITAILISQSVVAHEPRMVTPGQTEPIPFPGHETYLLSDSTDTQSSAAVMEIIVPAKTFGAPPHIHNKEDERFYVLEGEVEFLDRDHTFTAGPGTLVVLPRGNLHGFWNLSNEPARMLIIVTPGDFASFFDTVVSKIRETNAHRPEQVGAIIAQVASRYNVVVHPEKTPPSALLVLPK